MGETLGQGPALRIVKDTDPEDRHDGGASIRHPGASEAPEEREAWAVLLSVHGLGPAGFGALLGAYGSGRAILAAAGLRGAAARFARIVAEGDGRAPFREPVGESGLAVGIDGAAHSAVVADHCSTVAVLGSGHGRLFPRAHQRLATEIVAADGAVVSELWPEQPPSAHTFPQRNRVISGLAD